jgi:diguanylate cyclase (GGDEF)-like protein/PAS domain S-box-containing protein
MGELQKSDRSSDNDRVEVGIDQIPGTGWLARAYRIYLAITLGCAVVYLLLPPSTAAEMLFVTVAVSVPTAGWLALRNLEASERRTWVGLLTGLSIVACGEIGYFVAVWLQRDDVWEARLDVLFLLGYIVQLVSVLALIRRRATARNRADWLDAASIGVAAFIVMSSTIRTMVAERSDGNTLMWISQVFEPIVGVALVLMSVRLLIGERRPHPAFVLLVAGYLVQTGINSLASLSDTYDIGGAEDSLWLVAYALIGAALLHPERTSAPNRAPTAAVRTEIRQVLTTQAAVVVALIGVIGSSVVGRVPADLLFTWVAGGLAMLVFNRLRIHGLLKSVGEATLTEQQKVLAALVENSDDVIGRADPDGTVRFVSSSAARLTGMPPEWWIGRNFMDALGAVVENPAPLLERLDGIGRGQALEWQGEVRSKANNNVATLHITIVNHTDSPEIHGWVIAVRDVTDSSRLTEELRHQALHDSLTGLPNRALLADRIAHALQRATRNPGPPLTLLLVDLDDFKAVNDSLGHDHGDQLLHVVGERLLTSVRPGDTVARLGGDEFAILLEATGEDEAVTIARRIIETLSLPLVLPGATLAVRASIGVVCTDGPSTTAGELLRAADIAMYRSKREGKGRVTTFHGSMHDEAREQLQLRIELGNALARGEFGLVYQPIVDTASRALSGMEALLRWYHPTQGVVPPLDFIATAEQAGLINEIGAWVLQTACAEAASWPTGNPAPYISVNVSPVQLRQPDFAGVVNDALTSTGLAPSRLLLEITESVLVDHESRSRDTLHLLRALGVRIAIDDFGTGYSSLAYLRDLSVDVVKIDRAFVRDLARNADHRALTSTMLSLAEGLRMAAIAEGVETEEELEVLRALGCSFAQGYFYAKPAPIDLLGAWLPDRSTLAIDAG